jgi:hypothetical protein
MKEAVQDAYAERARAAAERDRALAKAEPRILDIAEERARNIRKGGSGPSAAETAHFENVKDVYGSVVQVLRDIADTPGGLGVLGVPGKMKGLAERIESFFGAGDTSQYYRTKYLDDLAFMKNQMATVLRKTGRGTNQQERELINVLTDAQGAMLGTKIPVVTLQTLQRNLYRLMTQSPVWATYNQPTMTPAEQSEAERTDAQIKDYLDRLKAPNPIEAPPAD